MGGTTTSVHWRAPHPCGLSFPFFSGGWAHLIVGRVDGRGSSCKRPWMGSSRDEPLQVTRMSRSFAGPRAPWLGPPGASARGGGEDADFDAGVRPPLIKGSLHVCLGNKGSLQRHLPRGPALAPPVTREPASAPSVPSGSRGPYAAARPLQALFSLGFWASGSFFLQILPKFCRLKTPLMQPKGKVNNPPRCRSSCPSRGREQAGRSGGTQA